ENKVEVANRGGPSSAQKVIGLADQRGDSLRYGFQAQVDHLVPTSIGVLEELDFIHTGLQVGRTERYHDLTCNVVSTRKGIPTFFAGLILPSVPRRSNRLSHLAGKIVLVTVDGRITLPGREATDENHQSRRGQPLWRIEPNDIALDPVFSAGQFVLIRGRNDVSLIENGFSRLLSVANGDMAEEHADCGPQHTNESFCLHVILHTHHFLGQPLNKLG